MSALRIISDSGEPFGDRTQAGDLLAGELEEFKGQKPVVLGVPRGGVIIARQVAERLQGDLDVVLAHKLGAPGNPELAIGAVCENGELFVDERIASYVGADDDYIEQEKNLQLQQIERRVQRYRQVLPRLSLEGRVVIVTDDGVATGATMQAALWAVRRENPATLVAALPVGPQDTMPKLSEHADETVCLRAPPVFSAIGQFYSQFAQVQDDELLKILNQENIRRTGA